MNWWEELRYDFKTVVSAGWSKNLIDDERIKNKFFSKEIEDIDELESRVAEVEGELSELLDEVEEWDEEDNGTKTAKKVKDYLKEVVRDLRASWQESALKEASRWESLIKKIELTEKELKKLKKELKAKQQELERKTQEKREALTSEEAKELLLEKFYDLVTQQLEKYLNTEKKELIKVFENLWNKYRVSLRELVAERDAEVEKLNEFLKKLGYLGSCES